MHRLLEGLRLYLFGEAEHSPRLDEEDAARHARPMKSSAILAVSPQGAPHSAEQPRR